MAKDYKHRGQGKQHSVRRDYHDGPQSISLWKWMLITALIIGFVVFLVYLRSTGTKPEQSETVVQTTPVPASTDSKNASNPQKKQEIKAESGPIIPQFDFYTILPEKEVVLPDYEIGTRAREERIGHAKETSYIMQAGSFKEFKDADNMKAKLALMGIESRVEKAKVGSATWYRVKMGPFDRMVSVSSIRARLRQNGIDVVVTEAGH
jgi:cell division protein FtsN